MWTAVWAADQARITGDEPKAVFEGTVARGPSLRDPDVRDDE